MAIRLIEQPQLIGHQSFARSSPFTVKDESALEAALQRHPNIDLHLIPASGQVYLSSVDGTWYTGFINGAEACVLDEILLPLLMEQEVVHLYQLAFTLQGLEGSRYSIAANGQWVYSDLRNIETAVAEQLLNA